MKRLKQIAREMSPFGRTPKALHLTALFAGFQEILKLNTRILDVMAEMGDKLGGHYVFDKQYIKATCRAMADLVHKLIYTLDIIAPGKYTRLHQVFTDINHEIEEELAGRLVIPQTEYVMPYELITSDYADVVGGKNANLAEIANRLGLTVPQGFAITTRAFKAFLEYNHLEDRMKTATAAWERQELSSHEASERISGWIRKGSAPPGLTRAISEALSRLRELAGSKNLPLAIRSSAYGEDSRHTFAGQYSSFLNESQAALIDRYKDVLADTYSASAMDYRRQKGFAEHEVAMAVACQIMVEARISGVIYTLNPLKPEQENMVIAATWGLGAPLVAGETEPDRFTVSREPPHPIVGLDIIRKTRELVAKPAGGCELRPVREDLQTRPCLGNDQLCHIAQAALMIERYFGKPQDIEWAIDSQGRLFILQARVLNIQIHASQLAEDIQSAIENHPVIFAGRGVIAQDGIATGKVFFVRSSEDLDDFPEGAILVARQTSPRFARVIKKARAIITDVGSPTGHMATIAREFRVPAIVNTGVATELLFPGCEITVDAQENVVYQGRVKELYLYDLVEEPFEASYEYRLLRRVLRRITPLNLVDPHARTFTPSRCKTFHDITRFVHEKAVQTLIDLKYHPRRAPDAPGKKLISDIPLDLILIDIGGGLAEGLSSPTVEPQQIISAPMQAFVQGLMAPGAWSSEPMSVDFGSFMSSLTRTFSSALASPKYVGQNLAVISREYANISLRLGYHFTMIDSYISENINDNYAYFRFLGGVTKLSRRSRRARFIAATLERKDFRVDLRGDLVVARIKKLGRQQMCEKLHSIGQLVAFTRQLDVVMVSDSQVADFLARFERLTDSNGTYRLGRRGG